MWDKEKDINIIGNKRKSFSIRIKVDLMRFVYPELFIVFSFIL